MNKHASINDNLETLTYGPAPEANDAVEAWFDSHQRKLGHFINNKWLHPPGRKYRKSTCPGECILSLSLSFDLYL
jgi:aldehyde dehydrogenase (NAD+)